MYKNHCSLEKRQLVQSEKYMSEHGRLAIVLSVSRLKIAVIMSKKTMIVGEDDDENNVGD